MMISDGNIPFLPVNNGEQAIFDDDDAGDLLNFNFTVTVPQFLSIIPNDDEQWLNPSSSNIRFKIISEVLARSSLYYSC